jgi:iron complex transport system substrate-binding protein
MVDRIVSLIPSGTEIVSALGGADRLVGRSHECDFPALVRSLPVCTSPKFDPSASSLEIDRSVRALVENALSVYRVHEKTLQTLRPDVIVTQSQCEICAVSHSDVEASVAAVLDAETTIASLEAVDLGGLWRDIQHVGEAIQTDSAGLIERLQSRLSEVRRDTTDGSRPRVFCLEWLEPMMFAGNWVPELIEMAGGEDLFAQSGAHSGVISWDGVVSCDPDIIILMPCGYDLSRTLEELPLLTNLPGWASLRAVRNGHVFATDGNHYFNRPGPRLIESLEILVEIMHPACRDHYGHRNTAWTPISTA